MRPIWATEIAIGNPAKRWANRAKLCIESYICNLSNCGLSNAVSSFEPILREGGRASAALKSAAFLLEHVAFRLIPQFVGVLGVICAQ